MERMEAIQWVLSVTISFRLSQSKTLADLVFGLGGNAGGTDKLG